MGFQQGLQWSLLQSASVPIRRLSPLGDIESHTKLEMITIKKTDLLPHSPVHTGANYVCQHVLSFCFCQGAPRCNCSVHICTNHSLDQLDDTDNSGVHCYHTTKFLISVVGSFRSRCRMHLPFSQINRHKYNNSRLPSG